MDSGDLGEGIIFKIRGLEDNLPILKNPKLWEQITAETQKKVAGEIPQCQSVFLGQCSVFLPHPLHTLLTGTSSSGKSFLMGAIRGLFPEKRVQWWSRISPNAFTYWHMGESNWDWTGKLCSLEDVGKNILESDVFKVMLSEGTKAAVVREQRTIEIPISGTPAFQITTAKNYINNEILNRFMVVSMTENEEQTRKIYEFHADRVSDVVNEGYDRELIDALHYLKPVKVKVTYAGRIASNFPSSLVKNRRDFPRFIKLISASAALHQYQREHVTLTDKTEYIIANKEDYEIARQIWNNISHTACYGLTHSQQHAYELLVKYCINEHLEPRFAKISEIHAAFPTISEKSWHEHINSLAEKGLIEAKYDVSTGGRPAVVYRPLCTPQKLNLPPFDELKDTHD